MYLASIEEKVELVRRTLAVMICRKTGPPSAKWERCNPKHPIWLQNHDERDVAKWAELPS